MNNTTRTALFLATISLATSFVAGCAVSEDAEPPVADDISDDDMSTRIRQLETPSSTQLDLAAQIDTCDPSFGPKVTAFVESGGRSAEPSLDGTCGDPTASLASCMRRAISNMTWTEAAACAAIPGPCVVIFCSGLI